MRGITVGLHASFGGTLAIINEHVALRAGKLNLKLEQKNIIKIVFKTLK
jgi:hypothetical protein